MNKDSNPGGYKGSSQELCEFCLKAEKKIYMDTYIKPVDRRLYYRCPKCGHTLWDLPEPSAQK